MNIVLPALFEDKLATNRQLRAAIDGTVGDFSIWLTTSRLPFFPDYTDHGIEHLSSVMETGAGLIPEESQGLFTAGDAAVFTLATLLHDSALHLTKDGFYDLIRGPRSGSLLTELDKESWPQLWTQFLFAARRWDDNQLTNVFGSPATLPPGDPLDRLQNLSEFDHKLIGEFIRAHHPRLAHEFAVHGVPGPSSKRIEPASEFGEDLRDLAGLVARSHGLPVRACMDYLGRRYHRREYQGIHAAYLMVILRISDFLQVQASRAPVLVFKYKEIPSPVSMQEWKAHQAVTNITQTHDDPESIEVQAKPADARTFLRLKEWLSGLQHELDSSWAVLGEVYGSHKSLSSLGLVILRVRSNLDDVRSFASTVDYVPDRIQFDVARADLLKLLIRPLYGDQPAVGIRELLQNAVDAVRERMDLQRTHLELRQLQLLQLEDDVEIWLDDVDKEAGAWLTVSDKGVGMTEEIIRDYFLKAGASYRFTEIWKHQFESDDVVRSRVLRSGRFGVGVLAAFLLGDVIEVRTRHVSRPYGVQFSTKLDGGPIEINKVPGRNVGTVVRIRISADVHQKLLKDYWARANVCPYWDWYCAESPVVGRLLGSQRRRLPQKYKINDGEDDRDYTTVQHAGYKGIRWTYDSDAAPPLSCNGITIRSGESAGGPHLSLEQTGMLRLDAPCIAVHDPDGRLPVRLQRDALATKTLPFNDALVISICDDLFAFLLTAPVSTPSEWLLLHYPGFGRRHGRRHGFARFIITSRGVALAEREVLAHANVHQVMVVPSLGGERVWIPPHTRDWDAIMLLHAEDGLMWKDEFIRLMTERYNGDVWLKMGFGAEPLGSKILATQAATYDPLERDGVPKYLRRSIRRSTSEDGLVFLDCGEQVQSRMDLGALREQLPAERKGRFPIAVELAVRTSERPEDRSLPAARWFELFQNGVIPFDIQERRAMHKLAFEALKKPIARWETIHSKTKTRGRHA